MWMLSASSSRRWVTRSGASWRAIAGWLDALDVDGDSSATLGMMTSRFRWETLKAGVTQDEKSGFSATGLSSGSIAEEIED
jgi:hypothetical protein